MQLPVTTTATGADKGRRGGRGARPGGVRRDVVAALAVTTTISYGVLFYAFSAILDPMRLKLRISATAATGALALASLTSAVLSVPVGRWLDIRGGRGLMTVGSILATAGMLAWSQAGSAIELYAAFVVIGVASAMVLYPPAFAIIVAVTAPQRRATALLGVTLVAGFASSIFIPTTGQLIQAFGWRHALAILAGLLGLATIPLHALALRHTRPQRSTPAAPQAANPTRVLRDGGFWLLATAFVLHSAALAVIGVHLVTYLTRLGHSPTTAASLTGLLGLLSVTGRVVMTVLRRWLPIVGITAVIVSAQGVAVAILPAAGHSVLGTAGCLIVFGLGFGIASLAKPAILLDRYGDHGYATIAGILGTPTTIAAALAPLGAAALAAEAGYTTLILVAGAACLLAGLAFVAVITSDRPRRDRHRPGPSDGPSLLWC